MVVVAAVLSLASCASSPSEDDVSPAQDGSKSSDTKASPESSKSAKSEPAQSKESVYLKEVRANIPGAAAYDDDLLLSMSTNVCALGSVDLGVRVLDNYSQIEAEDRAELATIALDAAC